MAGKAKFEARMVVYVRPAVAQAFEELASRGDLTVSDFLRDALVEYLRARGIPLGAVANGHDEARV